MLFIPLEDTEDIGEFLPVARFGDEELFSAGALQSLAAEVASDHALPSASVVIFNIKRAHL